MSRYSFQSLIYLAIVLLWICSSLPAADLVNDPSLIPALGYDSLPAWRLRAYGDINKDGIEDLVVSEETANCSQNGLKLFIYWGRPSGKYVFYDTIYEYIEGLSFERDNTGIRVWSYVTAGGGEGGLGYYTLSDSGFASGGGMKIFCGDGGGAISNAICDAVYRHSDVHFRIERYRIIDGEVEIADD